MGKIDFTHILDREDLVYIENEKGQYIHIDEIHKCEDYANDKISELSSEINKLRKDLLDSGIYVENKFKPETCTCPDFYKKDSPFSGVNYYCPIHGR